MLSDREVLAIIPTFMRNEDDLKLAWLTLDSLRETAPDCNILVVDDGSPYAHGVMSLGQNQHLLDYQLIAKESNDGFAATVNIGLEMAHADKMDALLVNADMKFADEGWLDRLRGTMEIRGGMSEHAPTEASVAGALLLFPNGQIQHAGTFFSVVTREFNHIYAYAPGNLAAALKPRVCPVTGALQLIRWETMDKIGFYDEGFKMGYEDVDYCHRVFSAGMQCVYNPLVRAIHFEGTFRRRKSADAPDLQKWSDQSWGHLIHKHAGESFVDHVPTMLWPDEF